MLIFKKGEVSSGSISSGKTKDYTVMANHHLRNTELSLKSKGAAYSEEQELYNRYSERRRGYNKEQYEKRKAADLPTAANQ